MTYQQETVSQRYGDKDYLAHNIKGKTAQGDRYLFGARVPSYGILNFGSIAKNQKKRITLADAGITVPISLVSAYAFMAGDADDSVTFYLLRNGAYLATLDVPYYNMPLSFPPGAIVMPDLTIEIQPKKDASQCLIYWQPVHILDEYEAS